MTAAMVRRAIGWTAVLALGAAMWTGAALLLIGAAR